MNVPSFEYLRATSLEQACALLSSHGKHAKILAGGTDLLVKMKHRRLIPPYLVDIKRIPGLDYMRYEQGDGLRIGPLTSIEQVKRSLVVRKRYPVLHQAAGYMATIAIRNQATLVGNICNGSPSAETAPALIVLDAQARVLGPGGERVVPVEDFFTGPGTTALAPDELVAELWIAEPPTGAGGAYHKHSLRRMDVAMVGVASLVVPEGEACGDIRIVLSAVAPTPMRAKKAEDVLRGQVPTEALVEAAAREAAAGSRPITDIRGTAESRKNIVETLTGQVIREALKAAKLEVR
jgi:aerobic carbon-monoxide dehydrogenase medium subunit